MRKSCYEKKKGRERDTERQRKSMGTGNFRGIRVPVELFWGYFYIVLFNLKKLAFLFMDPLCIISTCFLPDKKVLPFTHFDSCIYSSSFCSYSILSSSSSLVSIIKMRTLFVPLLLANLSSAHYLSYILYSSHTLSSLYVLLLVQRKKIKPLL